MVLFYFFRILKILDMQQIGRNYYNPKDPLNIPQHRFSNLPHNICSSIVQYHVIYV